MKARPVFLSTALAGATGRQLDCAFDPGVLSAWRGQVSNAARIPRLQQQIYHREWELLPHFSRHYHELSALPRRTRRTLQRKWKQSLAAVALLLALGQTPALAATINVGGGCALVNAIDSANQDASIRRCTAGRGKDTIVLPAKSTQTLTRVNNQENGPSGLPIVTSAITIAGNGSTLARSTASGTPDFRIFTVGAGGDLILQQTRVTGGSLSGQRRGGVYLRSGAVSLVGCTISGNSAYFGGGVANNAAGTLTVTNSTISGNTATGSGGGGLVNLGQVAVLNSIISGNTAVAGFGGGMRNHGIATLTDSTLAENSARLGGGVANRYASASLTLTRSTVSGNSAVQGGGGVWSYQSRATLTNSTVSRNTAGFVVGGLLDTFGLIVVANSTVSGNTATSTGGGVQHGWEQRR